MTASDEAKKAAIQAMIAEYRRRVELHVDLVGACAELRREKGQQARDFNAATADDLEDLLAENARLREAMAPFDRMSGAMFARNWNKDGVAVSFVEKDGPIRLTFDDFLAVRAALKGDTHE